MLAVDERICPWAIGLLATVAAATVQVEKSPALCNLVRMSDSERVRNQTVLAVGERIGPAEIRPLTTFH